MSDNKSSGGIGFIGLLQIVFIVLKLCKVITWSWLWVLSPLWISTLIVVLCLIIFYLVVRHKERKIQKEWKEWFHD